MLLVAGALALFGSTSKPLVVDNPTLISPEEEPLDDSENETTSYWQDESTDLYSITYHFEGIDNEATQEDIRRWAADRVRQFKQEGDFENLTDSDKEVLGFHRGMKYTLDFTYEMKESKTIVTYLVKTAYYSGGAHGNLEMISFNYDKETGNRLSLDSLFTVAAAKYLPVLSEKGNAYFTQKFPETFFKEGLDPKPVNWGVWYATDIELVFVFQTYQVLPYASGTPELRVRAADVGSTLNQEYF